MAIMKIQDEAWSTKGLMADFEDAEQTEVAAMLTSTTQAWLLNHTSQKLRGWSYNGYIGEFSGPRSMVAVQVVEELVGEALDFAISCLPEIKAEYGRK